MKKKAIVSYAAGSVLERVLVTLVCMISSVFMGHLGASELSAVSVSNTIIDIVQAMFIGLGIGATVVVSQFYTKGDEAQTQKACFQHLTISLLFSLVIVAVFQFWTEEIINLLFRNAAETVRNMTKRYLGCVKWVFPLLAIDNALTACFRGVKNAKLPFVFALGMNVLNVGLCVLFLYQMQLGYLGGAYAYVISIAASCVLKLLVVLLPLTPVRIRRFYAPEPAMIKSIVQIGLPMLVEYLLIKTGFLGMQVITALLGTTTLASYQIVNSVFNLLYAVTNGLETVQITYVSSYVAMQDRAGAEKLPANTLKFAEAFLLSVGAGIFLFSRGIASVFTKSNGIKSIGI